MIFSVKFLVLLDLLRRDKRMQNFSGKTWIWENNIKMDVKDIECEGVDWIHLAPDTDQWQTFLNMAINPRIL
jgi:hypothetical protein